MEPRSIPAIKLEFCEVQESCFFWQEGRKITFGRHVQIPIIKLFQNLGHFLGIIIKSAETSAQAQSIGTLFVRIG